MKQRIIKVASLLIFASCLLSCATATVYLEARDNYSVQDINYPAFFSFKNKEIKYFGYSLIQKRNISNHGSLPDSQDGGSYETQVGGVYQFSNGTGDIQDVEIVKNSEVFALADNLLTISNSSSYINITQVSGKFIHIPINDDSSSVVLQDSSLLPILMVKLNRSLQYGKVWKLWNNVPAGIKVMINNEEYAVIDLLSNPTIYLNRYFSVSLTDSEKDYVALLMLSIYEYKKSIENRNETVKLEK